MAIDPAVTETTYALAAANLGPFATLWPYDADSDVTVYVDFADGNGPQAIGGGDFTVTDLIPLLNGGDVTLSAGLLPGAAWAAGSRVTLKRATPESQPSTFGELDPFSPAAMEAASDNLARQIQDQGDTLARAIVAPLGEAGMTLPDASRRAGLFLSFDNLGNLTVSPIPPLPTGTAAFTPLAAGATLEVGQRYLCDSSGGPLTLTLPAVGTVADYDALEIWSGASAAVNAITVDVAGGGQIEAQGVLAAAIELNTNSTTITVAKFAGVWNVIGS